MVTTRCDYEGEAGRWTLWRRPPCVQLQGYVLELQAYQERGGPRLVRRELPKGFLPLIIVLGPGFELADASAPGGWRALKHSFLAGLHRAPAEVASYGESLCLQVDFTPLGARRFFRCELEALSDRVLDLETVAAAFASRLEGQLFDCASWEERLDLLESVLIRRIHGSPNCDPRLARAYYALAQHDGALSISGLAADLEVSRKHLNALFKRELGMSPKLFARTLRFAKAVERLSAREQRPLSLAALAADCGYADQSHFTRDFKTFAGETPRSLYSRLLPDRHGLLAGVSE